MLELLPLGDRAFLARFGSEREAQGWAGAVQARSLPGVVDVAVAYATAAIFLDPDRADPDEVEAVLREVRPLPPGEDRSRLIRLPVLYDGEDLTEVAATVGLTEAEVAQRHSSVDYAVFALGFLPGFPYSGYLPEPLAGLARRAVPRARVPAGSVAIAGRQTGVYPGESPGGWHLLGRCPLRIVDLASGFLPIRAGDRLRFVAIGEAEYLDRLGDRVDLAQYVQGAYT